MPPIQSSLPTPSRGAGGFFLSRHIHSFRAQITVSLVHVRGDFEEMSVAHTVSLLTVFALLPFCFFISATHHSTACRGCEGPEDKKTREKGAREAG